MSNILSFTLGLSAAGFAKGIQTAESGVKGLSNEIHKADTKGMLDGIKEIGSHASKLLGVGTAIGAVVGSVEGMINVVEGVMGQIEKGAALEKLSRTTGETVGNLYRLQKGIIAAGGEAESAGNMVYLLQKSLGGVNEEGESTAGIFSQLGLSIEQLKKMSAPEAIQKIGQEINKLDNASAAFASGKIFGRSEAKNFLELARSSGEFAEGLRKSSDAAAVMDKNAENFEKIEKSMLKAKNMLKTFYLELAAGIAPAIQKVLDVLNKIDLSGFSKKISDVLTLMGETIEQRRLGELLQASLEVGMEGFTNFFNATLDGMATAIITIMGNLDRQTTTVIN